MENQDIQGKTIQLINQSKTTLTINEYFYTFTLKIIQPKILC
jgi:phage gp16-like protein